MEQYGKGADYELETPKTEEMKTPVNSEEKKEEAPKKKKNIIRVYHAQNASDGGKGRRRPPEGAGRPVRPAGRPAPRPAGAEGAARPARPAGAEGAVRPVRPAGAEGAARPARPVGAEGAVRPARPAGAEGAARAAKPAGTEGTVRPVKPVQAEGAARPAARETASVKEAEEKAAVKEAAAAVKGSVDSQNTAGAEEKKEPAAKKTEEKTGSTVRKTEEKEEPVVKKAEEKAEPAAKKEEEKAEPAPKKAEEKAEPVPGKAEPAVKKEEEKAEPTVKKAEEKAEAAPKKTEEKAEAAPKKAEEKAETAPKKTEEKAEAAPKKTEEKSEAAPKKAEEKAEAAPKKTEEKTEAAPKKAEEKTEAAVKKPLDKAGSPDGKRTEQKDRPMSKPAAAAEKKTGQEAGMRTSGRPAREPARAEGRDNRPASQRTDGRPAERRDGQRDGQRSTAPGQGRQPRQGDASRTPRTEGGQNRFGRSEGRTEGGRPEGTRADGSRPRYGQGQGQGRPGQEGRSFGQRNDGRSQDRPGDRNTDRDGNRFGGQQNRTGAQRPGARRTGGQDASFTPELSKTSKDSKRERDRENKNKKKDFDKTQETGRKNTQTSTRQNQKPVQKPQQPPKQEEKKPEIKEIILPEKLTIRELADAMKIQPSAIVKKLFLQGMMVTVNQEIDFEKAQEIALDYDIIAEKEEKVDVIEELLREDEEDESRMVPRPPVVCVMGHVDHGKTSLLDAIRNTNVTRGEAGGITQHIGAYVATINGQKITFLDTPGHEAFTAMRMRGANATDIAVLVVAADDGVMPQTIEAISHAKAAGVDIIVAINKIDKPSANIERVKQELSEYELIPEDWGGSTVFVPVSAKTGEGIDTLLEMILLTAEVAELKANPDRAARGLVIEAQLDKGKGPVATILIQKGTLHVGDFIAAGSCSGKVRAMMDDKGRRVKEALPSTPVEILGLSDVPNAGEVLMSFSSDKEAKNFAAAFVSENKNRLLEETKGKLSLDNLFDQIQASDLKELPIIVKADVQGSVEAVRQSLLKLSNEEVVVKVIHGGVGAINESDVTLAATTNAIIIGFNVRPDAMAKQVAEQEKVDMRLYKVIYQAIEDVEAAMKGMLDPVYEEKVIGHAQVRQLFKASGVGTIAGSYVLDGIFQRSCKVRITREGEQVFEGELASLKRFKDDVKEVRAGYECGLVIEGFNDLKEDDLIEAYVMVEVPR